MSAQILFTEIINGSRELAVESVNISKSYEGFALKLVSLSDKLEALINNFDVELREKSTDLVVVENEFKHHPAIDGILNNKPVSTEIETKNLSKLKRYMFIKVLKNNGEYITYVKVKDNKAEILHHKLEMGKGSGIQDFEVDKAYLVYQETIVTGKGARKADGIWHFGQEISENKVMAMANRLSSFFAKAKEQKVRY